MAKAWRSMIHPVDCAPLAWRLEPGTSRRHFFLFSLTAFPKKVLPLLFSFPSAAHSDPSLSQSLSPEAHDRFALLGVANLVTVSLYQALLVDATSFHSSSSSSSSVHSPSSSSSSSPANCRIIPRNHPLFLVDVKELSLTDSTSSS